MVESLIAAGSAIIVGVLSLIGVIITNSRSANKMQTELKTAQAVTNEIISELRREVHMHNDFARRIPVIEEQIRVVNHRVNDLEGFHKHP